MSDVVGSAYVELRAELDRFESDIKKGAGKALDSLGPVARDAGTDVEKALGTAADTAKADMERIGDGMGDVEGDARSAGAGIEKAMKGAADGSVASIEKAGGQMESELESAGDSGGSGFEKGFSGKAMAGVVAFGVAAGQALVAAFNKAGDLVGDAFSQALEQRDMPAMIEAQLDVPPAFAAELGKEASGLYRDAWGESLSEVQENLVNAQQSIGRYGEVGVDELGRITEKAYQMSGVFGTDVGQSIEQAGMLFRTGLADSGTEALDLLAASMQQVPVSLRDELFEATNEYSQFFAALGLSGEETMGILVTASEDGVYGIDKAGDAIKEFTIRATDMSSATGDAYKAIGLDMNDMTNALLAGGDESRAAFDKIVKGLLAIEDPGEQAAAAIALFGTPLEDLGTQEIPEFLTGLGGMQEGMLNVEGVGGQMAAATGTWQASLESFKRKALGGISDFIQVTVLPILQSFGEWWTANLPTIQAAWQNVVTALQTAWTTFGAPLFAIISEQFGAIVAMVMESWPQISATIQSVMTTVMTILSAAIEIISFWWDTFGTHIIETIRIAFTFIMTTIEAVMLVVQGIIDTVMGLITGDWDRAWNGIKKIFEGVMTFLRGLVQAAMDRVKNIIAAAMSLIRAVFSGAWNAVIQFLVSVGTRILGVVRGAWNSVTTATRVGLNAIITWVKGLPGRAVTALSTLGTKIAEVARAAFAAAKEKVISVGGEIIDWVGGLPAALLEKLAGLGESMISGLGSLLKSAWNSLIDTLPTFHVRIDPPGPGVLFDEHISLDFLKLAGGGIIPATPGGMPALIAEGGGAEAVVPLTRPKRMDAIMDESGMTARALARYGRLGSDAPSGPLVSFPGAIIQDATDVEKVAQRTMAAYRLRGVRA